MTDGSRALVIGGGGWVDPNPGTGPTSHRDELHRMSEL